MRITRSNSWTQYQLATQIALNCIETDCIESPYPQYKIDESDEFCTSLRTSALHFKGSLTVANQSAFMASFMQVFRKTRLLGKHRIERLIHSGAFTPTTHCAKTLWGSNGPCVTSRDCIAQNNVQIGLNSDSSIQTILCSRHCAQLKPQATESSSDSSPLNAFEALAISATMVKLQMIHAALPIASKTNGMTRSTNWKPTTNEG